MLDLDHHAVGAHFEIAGRFALWDFGVERRPFRAGLAALEAEADLLAGPAPVARLAVDRHSPGMDFLVAELLRAGLEHLEIVVAGQARNAVGARHAHLVLGLGVPRLHLGERDRPVQQVGAGYAAVGALDLELMLVEAQRSAGPVRGRAADRLDDPGRQVGEVLGDPPASGRRAHVLPGELGEAVPFVVDEVLRFSMRGPASRITTLTPFCASSLPSVPPPAPEPTITTTPPSFRSNFAMCCSSLTVRLPKVIARPFQRLRPSGASRCRRSRA